MSTLKELYGKTVKVVSTDPTDAGAEGQVWYNSTSGTFKTVLSVGAWSSGGNVNTARRYVFGAGTQTASLLVNGYSTGFSNASEEYNGSSWTSVTNAPFSVYNSAGGGIQTAAFLTGGDLGTAINQVTGEYNGSSWTTTNNNPNAKNGGGGCGTQTAGLYAGGQGSNGTQTYDGSWTSTGHTLNSPRTEVACAMTGTSTAALIVGSQPSSDVVEEYNGSSWTSQTVVPTAGYARSSSGIQTAALYYGGGSTGFGGTTAAEYNGLSWTNVADLATPRGGGGSGKGAGTSSLAFMAAGQTPGPSNSNQTEEFTTSIYSPVAATWASGGNLNTARDQGSSGGTASASWVATGQSPPSYTLITNTEEYDGSAWTAGGAYPVAVRISAGFGTQTAAVATGGFNSSPSIISTTAHYNGSTWTTATSYPTGNYGMGSAGTQTAGIVYSGGQPSAYSTTTKEYDGSTWTAANAMNTARNYPYGCGVQTALLSGQGNISTGPSTNITEEYDGTNWTSGPNNVVSVRGSSATGSTTAAISYGGNTDPGTTTVTALYNGSTWATDASISQERQFGGSNSTDSSLNAVFGGGGTAPGAQVTNTEEYVAASQVLDYKTLTSS